MDYYGEDVTSYRTFQLAQLMRPYLQNKNELFNGVKPASSMVTMIMIMIMMMMNDDDNDVMTM